MTWTNMFDIGPCELAIWDNFNEEYVDPEDYDSLGLSISVSNGVVEFEQPLGSASYYAVVVPSYDVAQRRVRIAEAGILSDTPIFGGAVGATLLGQDGTVQTRSYDSVANSQWPFDPEPLEIVEQGTPDPYDAAGFNPQEFQN